MAKNVLQAPSSESREYGLASVKAGKEKVRIEFLEGEKKVYKISRDELPKHPKLPEDYEGELMVVLNSDKDGVERFAPKEGRVRAHCIDFIRPGNDATNDPEPVLVEPSDPKRKPYKKFTAMWEVIDGKASGLSWKGALLFQFLRYRLQSNDEGNTMFDGSPDASKAIHVPYLKEFLEKTDCVDEEIPWPDDGNVLPELLRRILKKNKTIELIFKGGFINSLLDVDYEDEDDEEPKKKSESKKVSKDEDEDDDL